MELTIIGCSGSSPGPRSPASCYLLRHEGFALVLDLGPGGLGGLWGHLDPREIGAIALSHLHPDHCLDLCAFQVAAAYSPLSGWPRIPVFGPEHARERMTAAYAAHPGEEVEWLVDFRPWQPEQTIGPFTLRVVPARHSTQAWSVRVEAAGAALVYSGDTGPNPGLIDLARDADLLLAEASWPHRDDRPPDVHLSGRQAAEHATAAGVRSLMLTHIPPWYSPDAAYAEARGHYAGPLLVAAPGMTVTISGHLT